MKSRHSLVLASTLAAAVLGTVPALAKPSFADDDLKGEYLFVVVEVERVQLPTGAYVPQHCVSAGTATFDGAGKMTLSGERRCNQTGSGSFSEDQVYEVKPDGSFLIYPPAMPSDPVHGQLVDHGRTLLLDGTLRMNPNLNAWWGTAMKR